MSEEFVKPECPKCGRKNVRARQTKAKKYLCLLCGYEGTDEEFLTKKTETTAVTTVPQ